MNARRFLLLGGITLTIVAVFGFVGLLGPTAEKSIFGGGWWFDNVENWAHLIVGLLAIMLMQMPKAAHKPAVVILGVIGLFFAIYNFFSGTFFSANLEMPADLIFHLFMGVWALWSAFWKEKPAVAGTVRA